MHTHLITFLTPSRPDLLLHRWANAVHYIPNITTSTEAASLRQRTRSHREPDDTVGWWQDVMKTLFWVGYGVSQKDVGMARGVGRYVQNLALLRASACPLKRNSSTHVMVDARAALRSVSVIRTSDQPRNQLASR